MAQLAEADRGEFLEGLGLHDSGLDRVIRAGYDLLGLITYFTVGPKEARAWTIVRGTKRAAGRRGHPQRFRAWLHRLRNHRLRRLRRRQRRGRAPRRPAGCGWKARTTWCGTATSCCSASTSDSAGRRAGSLAYRDDRRRLCGPGLGRLPRRVRQRRGGGGGRPGQAGGAAAKAACRSSNPGWTGWSPRTSPPGACRSATTSPPRWPAPRRCSSPSAPHRGAATAMPT